MPIAARMQPITKRPHRLKLGREQASLGHLHDLGLSGQTLLCRALGLKVPDWDARRFDPRRLFVEDLGARPERIIQTTRLGIPAGRDEHLPYRFVDAAFARFCTRNPLRRGQVEGRDYSLLDGAKVPA